ncbi:CAP-Gly domain-containing linker protein 1 isoform X1 [Neodiprion pinetum]|uniref:CAP-Gly domain-containing linker protein 1 isoform X1 n=2 Tax=Neodiprion pinetum TaxID=441929 RepID=UPI001EDF08AC|nr:restin homolog isoform X1 [Neodiprion pinetum]XP_046474835.1 restin homolog isoform X1 [Neodiprion pinetum]
MTEAKLSGLRPPTKIGRPCCASGPKPSVPPSPSRSSAKNSMEHLWETHGRRLSETGSRRDSDTSVVLTEDTDSFIIGDRVWVGGTKPGLIAYIGETQFAPGDWAGIVLDEPIGKNDGSVAGSRYFQCEPKRGVFSRLTRLTRRPLSDLPPSALSPTQRTPTSPTESTRGNLSKSISPSLNTSTTSLSSVSHRELRLGERVIVSSSQGSKAGILRFMGTTEFANGEWCGIELDDPVGKNDGSVGEKRYFECRPKHGLFAPIHKVSRSPSSKRSSTCIVHKPTGAALNMALRKMGSRESLLSTSSISSTQASTVSKSAAASARKPGIRTSTPTRSSVQEMLKDKQIEIEHLHKERDLERQRVTRAANQADQAEHTILLMKQEYERYRENMEKKIQDAEQALAQLLDEKSILVTQLDEERRKCEDLLFRFEEESVDKDAIQQEKTTQNVTNSLNENKIKELELKLSEERERVVQLEQDSIKLFEAEEELTKLRSELSSTVGQDQSASEELQKLGQQLEEMQKTLQLKENEKSDLIARYEEQIKTFQAQLTEHEKSTASLTDSESTLKNELEHAKQSLESRNTIISQMSQKYDNDIAKLKEDIQQSVITMDNITRNNTLSQESLISKYENIVSEKDNIIKQKTEELDTEVKRNLEMQKTNLEQLKSDNTKRFEELSDTFKSQLTEKELKIVNITSQLDEKNKEIEKLMTEMKICNQSRDSELQKAFLEIEDLKQKLKSLDENNNYLKNQIQTLELKIEDDNKKFDYEKKKLEIDIADFKSSSLDTLAQLKQLKEELSNKETEISNLSESNVKTIEQMAKDIENKLSAKEEIIQQLKLETVNKTKEIENAQQEITDLKAIVLQKTTEVEQFSKKCTELENSISASVNGKTLLETELQSLTSTNAELNRKLITLEEKNSLLVEQKKKLELDICNLISSTANSSDQLIKYNEDLRQKEQELDEVRDKVGQIQNSLESVQNTLKSTEQDLEKSQLLNKEFNSKVDEVQGLLMSEKKINTDLTLQLGSLKNRERELVETVDKGKDLSLEIEKKTNQVTELNTQLGFRDQEIGELKDRCKELQKLHDETIENTNKEKIISENLIKDLKVRVEEFSQELKTLQQSKQKLENELNGREQSIEEIVQKLNSEVNSKENLNKLFLEATSQLNLSEKKMKAMQEEIDIRDDNLTSMNVKYNHGLTQIALLKSANDNSASEAQMKLVTMEKQLANITTEHETVTKSLAEITQLHGELNTKLADATENNKILTTKVTDTETQLKSEKDLVSELNNKIIAFEEKSAQSVRELAKLNEELKIEKQNSNSALEEKRVLQDAIKVLQEQLLAMQNDLSVKKSAEVELIAKLENSTKAQEKSCQDIEVAKETEIKNLKSNLDKVALQNAELIKNMNSLKATITQKDTEFSIMKKSLDELNAQVKHAEKTECEQTKTIEEYQMKLTTQQLELDNTNKQNLNLRQTKESLETLLQEKEQSISAIKESLNKDIQDKSNAKELTHQLNLVHAEVNQLKETESNLKKELAEVNKKWVEAKEALKLAGQNQKNLKDVEVIPSNQSIHPAGGDVSKNKKIIGNDVDMDKLLEEHELAQGQIDFLNSVIIDMKKKNDALTCKVEVLEMGIPPSEADDYNLISINSRMAAPRMYCDICDQFDLHDTEDCPRQAQDSPEPETSQRTPKKQPGERPYCDVCEVFGHDTTNCEDEETF